MRIILVSLVVALALASVVSSSAMDAQAVPVDVGIMSKCPYAAQMITGIWSKLYATIGSIMDLRFLFIAQQNPTAKYGFTSKHGDTEVAGDLYELCAQQLYPNTSFNYIHCLSQSYSSIPENAQSCASKFRLNATELSTCAFGPQGKQLMITSIEKVHSLDILYSPTTFIDGKRYCLGSDCKPEKQMISYICSLYKGSPKPAACNA